MDIKKLNITILDLYTLLTAPIIYGLEYYHGSVHKDFRFQIKFVIE